MTQLAIKISIVLPAFNEERLIGTALERVGEASEAFCDRGWTFETIVCDNNSTDATGRIAREAGARVVFEPVNQIARARNTGARIAAGEWLMFIDADSEPSRELFEGAAVEIESGTCLAGGSVLDMKTSSALANWTVGGWNRLSRFMRYMAGAFIFCQASAFREIGGFNETFYASEEIDLSQRLKREAKLRGKRIVILTEHPLRTSPRKIGLYSTREYARFIATNMLTLGRAVKSRDRCHIWYDGRR